MHGVAVSGYLGLWGYKLGQANATNTGQLCQDWFNANQNTLVANLRLQAFPKLPQCPCRLYEGRGVGGALGTADWVKHAEKNATDGSKLTCLTLSKAAAYKHWPYGKVS
jgi:hypothetical protein